MKKKKNGCLTLFALLVVVGAFGAFVVYQQFFGGSLRNEKNLSVSKDFSYEQLIDSLSPVIKNRVAFDLYAERLSLSQTFKAGRYHLTPSMSVVEVVRALKLGLQAPVNVTINNVRTVGQLASKVAAQLDIDSVEFVHYVAQAEVAKKYGFTPTTIFSMFIPNTYELYWTTSVEKFVERMSRENDRFWSGERDELRKKIGLSRLEVMTLASIVNEETRQRDEMARVAGVYMNRLHKGMLLQADPTVKYAMGDFELKRILYKHLSYPSPYNTYVTVGLPPSPICMPDVVCIDAVLRYERHNYLYFCARPTFDGYHNFATTLSQHNANARAWSAELNRRNVK